MVPNRIITSAHQPVPRAPNRLDHRIVAELGAESAHVYLDDVGIAVEVEIPYVLEDVALRHNLVGMSQQMLDDREFAAGELDLPTAKPHPSRRRVKSQIARLEHG